MARARSKNYCAASFFDFLQYHLGGGGGYLGRKKILVSTYYGRTKRVF